VELALNQEQMARKEHHQQMKLAAMLEIKFD